MMVDQLYTKCLAQGAYYIESEGEVAIIDPLREVDAYIQKANEQGATIKYIFETHFHADFVSGHLTLAEKTGATIVFGPSAKAEFAAHTAKDGESFSIGNLTLKVLHTPGHTMESTTYLLLDEEQKEKAIFTGDTLFLGDVGRPDLAQKAANRTQAELAGILYDSLRNKIMPLPDDVIVYPGHGAGSACGKNMMKETQDTLGNQKKRNYALREDMTKDEFIKEVTEGLLPPPGYFPYNVKMNKEGYLPIDNVLESGTKALSVEEFKTICKNEKALVLDVRSTEEFIQAHIPNSIFIGLDGGFAPWVGQILVNVQQPLLLVVTEGREKEAVTRLARVGFDHTLGYLNGGIEAWTKANEKTESLQSITAEAFAKEYVQGQNKVIDVRKEGEFSASHLQEAQLIPLRKVKEKIEDFPKEETFYLHCAGGYRSVIAASLLKANGIHQFIDIKGGFGAIKKTNLARIEGQTCCSKG